MKKYYKFRIMLMTFALGLASVFMLNGLMKSTNEIKVNLPEIETEVPIIVFPIESKLIVVADDNGCPGVPIEYENQRTKNEKKNLKKKK